MAPRSDASIALELLCRSAAASRSPGPGPEVVGASGGRPRVSTRSVVSGDVGSTPRSGGESSAAATAKTPASAKRVGSEGSAEATGTSRRARAATPTTPDDRPPPVSVGDVASSGKKRTTASAKSRRSPAGGGARAGAPSSADRARHPFRVRHRFDEFWSRDAVERGLRRGELHVGKIRVNPHRRWEAYVSLEGVPHDVKLDGFPAQNRTIEGDLVVIAVDPIASWPLLDDKNGTPRRRAGRPDAASSPSAADHPGWTPAGASAEGEGEGEGGDSPWWNRDETDANDPRDDHHRGTVEDEDHGEDDPTLAADDEASMGRMGTQTPDTGRQPRSLAVSPVSPSTRTTTARERTRARDQVLVSVRVRPRASRASPRRRGAEGPEERLSDRRVGWSPSARRRPSATSSSATSISPTPPGARECPPEVHLPRVRVRVRVRAVPSRPAVRFPRFGCTPWTRDFPRCPWRCRRRFSPRGRRRRRALRAGWRIFARVW